MTTMSQVLRELMAREYVVGRVGDAIAAADEIAPKASPSARVQLWSLQLLLPDLVAALEVAIREAGEKGHHARRMAGGLLTYVYNPLDLIGDETPLGRIDDTLICAIGLKRLHDTKHVELPPAVLAICQLAEIHMVHLRPELQEDIRGFVRGLEEST